MQGQFFLSLLNFQLYFGFLTCYRAVQYQIRDQFLLPSYFLSVVDSLNLLCRVIFTLFLIFHPPRKLKQTFMIVGFLEVASFAIMSLAHVWPAHHLPLLIISAIFIGLSQGSGVLPFMIAFKNLNGGEHPALMNIWMSLTTLGGLYGVLVVMLTTYVFEWNWHSTLLLYSMLFLASTFHFNSAEEVHIQERQVSICGILQEIDQHYQRKTSNFLLLMEYACLGVMLNLMYFWLPYYYYQIGLNISSLAFSLAIALGGSLGSLVFIPLAGSWADKKPVVTSSLLFLNLGLAISLFFNSSDQESVPIYLVQLCFVNLAFTVPLVLTLSSELDEKTPTGREKYLVLNFMGVVREVLSILLQILVYLILDTNKHWFLYVVIFVALMCLTVHIMRRVFERLEQSAEEQNPSDSLEDENNP